MCIGILKPQQQILQAEICVTEGREERDKRGQKGKGNQETRTKDPWTKTKGGGIGLSVGGGSGEAGESGGGNWGQLC